MFERSVRYYDALYRSRNTPAAMEALRAWLPGATSLLDVGCGPGSTLAALRSDYDVAGVDLSSEMIEMARHRCPGVPFTIDDMCTFSLGRRFDAVVCLFSAVGYVRTVERMFAAVARMADHLSPDGVLIVEPWFTPETYWVDRLTWNVVDRPDLKISWMYISEREGLLSRLRIHFQVGTPDGIEQFVEIHELGLFTDDEYRRAFAAAGLAVTLERPAEYGRGLYVGRRLQQHA